MPSRPRSFSRRYGGFAAIASANERALTMTLQTCLSRITALAIAGQPFPKHLRGLICDRCARWSRYLAHRSSNRFRRRRQLRAALATAPRILRDSAQALWAFLGWRRLRLRAITVHQLI